MRVAGFTRSLGVARFCSLACLLALAACSLPEPDGTEAALIEKAAGLPVLTSGENRSAESAVRNALLLSPEVRAAASRISASADEVRVQRAALFPSLGLSIGGGVGEAGQGNATIDLTGRQVILDFGKTKRAVTAADIDLQIDYISFQQSVDTTIADALEAYDQVLRYVLLLEVRQSQFAALKDLQTLVMERTTIGAAPTSDLLETRKRVQAAEFLVHDTELLLAESRDRLAQMTGQSRGGRVPPLRAGSCLSPDVPNEVRKAELELAKAQLGLESAERARQPRAYIEPLARHRAGERGVSLGVNIGVDSDLLQGGALSARVNAARNTRDSANADVDAVRRTVALEDGRLKREIAAAGRRFAMLNRQIDLLVQTRDLYRSQYFELGTREISELLDNEDEYYSRKAELIDLNSELLESKIKCSLREDTLRRTLGIQDETLYGYPLISNAI